MPIKLPILSVDNYEIERSSSKNFIRVMVDEHLNWKDCISILGSKLSKEKFQYESSDIFYWPSFVTHFFTTIWLTEILLGVAQLSQNWKNFSANKDKRLKLFNRDLNRGCLVYMFSLRFSGSKFLINLRRQFRVRKIFRTQAFAGFACILCLKLLHRKWVICVVVCSFIKTCSLTSC